MSKTTSFSIKLFHFWVPQVRKSHACGISTIFLQWCFMTETQVSMTVSDFWCFFSRNHFLERSFTFQWGCPPHAPSHYGKPCKGHTKITPRTLKGHLKGTRELWHSKGTWHLVTRVLEALGYLGTWVIKALGKFRSCSSLPTLINLFGMFNILDDVESHIDVFSFSNWSILHADFISDINVGNI